MNRLSLAALALVGALALFSAQQGGAAAQRLPAALLLSKDGSYVVLHSDGRTLGRVAERLQHGYLAVAPDGRRVAYTVAPLQGGPGASLHVLSLVTGEDRVVAASDYLDSPSWSPDGRRIVFERVVDPAPPELAVVPVQGGSATRLKVSGLLPTVASPIWSTDGSQIAFVNARSLWSLETIGLADQRVRSLVSVRLPGGGFQRFLPQLTRASWSPDGSRLGFSDEKHGVRIVSADGHHLTRLVDGREPLWSPDGGVIAYVRWRESVNLQLATVRLADRRITLLGVTGLLRPLQWLPEAAVARLERLR